MQLIISLLLVTLWWTAGFAIQRYLRLKLTITEKLAVGWVFGFFVAMWLSYLFVLLVGYGYGLPLVYIVLAGVSLLGLRVPQTTNLPEVLPRHKAGRYLYLGVVASFIVLIVLLTYGHFLKVDVQGNWISGGYTWADMALHQTLAAYFAHQPQFQLGLPIFSGTNLSYPFLTDYLSGTVFRLGGSWQYAFFLPSLISVLALCRLLITLGYRVFKRMRPAWLLLVLMLGSGSGAGWLLFVDTWLRKGFADAMQLDWTMQPEKGLAVANWVTSHLLPQRTYLAGFLVFLVLTLLWKECLQKPRRVLLVIGAILYGGLPFVHVHSFLVLTVLGGCMVVWRTVKKQPVRDLVIAALGAWVLAIPQVVWQLRVSFDQGFSYQTFGWMTLEGQSILSFWISNWGGLLILAPLGAYFLWKKRFGQSWAVPLIVSGLLLFIVCNLYSFQPYIWDNMKLLTYSYFFLLFPTVYFIEFLVQKKFWLVAVVLVFFLSASGVQVLVREFGERYVFLRASEVRAGTAMLDYIPDDAVVLTSERHNHPVTLVSGRQLFSGYPGWLWSYGIDVAPRMKVAKELWSGSDNTPEYLNGFGITHAVLGPDEVDETGYTEQAFGEYFEEVATVDGWKVFKAR